MVIETRKPEETYELGRKMGREAEPGQIVCLSGDLGVGKSMDWILTRCYWEAEVLGRT